MAERTERTVNYLRISITDRCNLRCVYCMGEGGVALAPPGDILSYEEVLKVAEAAVALGVDRFRITGGEPLLRKGVVDLIARLGSLPGVREVTLTSNGLLLGHMARKLREAGLARVNLSLDSLRPEVYAAITRGGTLRTALEGLVAALEAGLSPVKVNAVMLGGVNDADLVDLALLAWAYPVVVRFIELMPLGDPEARSAGNFVSGQALLARLARQGGLSPVAKVPGSGPAMYHEWMPRRPPRRLPRLPGLGPSRTGPAVIGVISPITRPFCSTCNRLRLTARGMLHACLAADGGVDLRRAIRMGAGSAELASLIAQAVAQKPPSHGMASGRPSRTGRKMSELGG